MQNFCISFAFINYASLINISEFFNTKQIHSDIWKEEGGGGTNKQTTELEQEQSCALGYLSIYLSMYFWINELNSSCRIFV